MSPGALPLSKQKTRVTFILKKLNELYPDPPVPLAHDSPYTLLIAVLLSAHSTDARVNKVTPVLFKRARTPLAMSQLPEAEILTIVRSCGLGPRKAAAISELSKILNKKYSGQVPQTLEELEELPGVGHKTAQVVMAQAFNQAALPVDTHIHRLAARWRLSDGRSVLQTERDLKALFPVETWSKLHLQMIYYGREHCKARGCDGLRCLICSQLNKTNTAKKKASGLKVKQKSVLS